LLDAEFEVDVSVSDLGQFGFYLSGLKKDYDVKEKMMKQVSDSKSELVIAQNVPLPFA